jgi:hypothetical protein
MDTTLAMDSATLLEFAAAVIDKPDAFRTVTVLAGQNVGSFDVTIPDVIDVNMTA